KPSCHFLIWERFAIAKICPAVGESTCAWGWPRLTWLNALKSSARNCRLILSVKANRLLNEASVLNRCGPKNELRATFPNVPAAVIFAAVHEVMVPEKVVVLEIECAGPGEVALELQPAGEPLLGPHL